MGELVLCPGCGLELPESDGPTHAYLGASAACWAVFGEVLAKEYQDARYYKVHQLTVDAYAAQHPGKPERKSIQSVALHLVGLHLALERSRPPEAILAAHRACAARARDFIWLDPPAPPFDMTILDVAAADTAEDHGTRVHAHADAVWRTWTPHHGIIRHWAEAY